MIVGLTKVTYFAKLVNLARIHQGSGKRFQWDNKRGLLAAGNFHENGKLEKLARIHQKFSKNSNKVTKREIFSLNFIRLLRVVITPSVTSESTGR